MSTGSCARSSSRTRNLSSSASSCSSWSPSTGRRWTRFSEGLERAVPRASDVRRRAVEMFSRVLVANRGEIAVRIIRALHELDVEAVAIYSTADKDAMHVRLADHAVCVGPPSAAQSYLRMENVIAAAQTSGCEAVHPGYGFLSERPAFVEACEENDLVFVGPPADVMAMMGDKISAKQAMRAADVPTVPGTEGATTITDVQAVAAEVGFPLLLDR